ncbi:MAG: glycosyltransferase family 4 protein [Bacteroidetes bacterium]|nr:glycosyltransferase family 4 protein [Bacteroidota bacterium]
MKILHVIPSLNKGGAERLAVNISTELGHRPGVDIKLVTFRKDNAYLGLIGDVDAQTIPAFVIPSLTGKGRVDVHSWIRLLDEFKPDVIHSHLFESEMVTRYTLRPGTVYVTHCHDNMAQLKSFSCNTLFNKTALTNFYERRLILKQYEKCNNHFVAISKDNFDFIRSVLPDSLKQNVLLMHNAIHFKKFNVADRERNRAEIRMVNTGRFVSWKNQIFLVEILKLLRDRGVIATITFLGDGAELALVKAKVIEYGLQNQIEFTGNVEHVEAYLRNANLYVHTAYIEPFGLALVEAMAAGLPVIALDGGGNRDLIQEGVNGYCIKKQEADLFADKIIGLMRNETLYHTMSRNAVAFAKGFDMPAYVDRLLEMYQQWVRENNQSIKADSTKAG